MHEQAASSEEQFGQQLGICKVISRYCLELGRWLARRLEAVLPPPQIAARDEVTWLR